MADYVSNYSGDQIDDAVRRAIGFGLGGDTTRVDSFDDVRKTGFYSSLNGCPDGAGWWYGIYTAHNSSAGVLEAFRLDTSAREVYRATRVYYDGTWGAWEWVNPTMRLGVEYRTTERYLGKPVYAKLVNFGALPNSTTTRVDHGIAGLSYCIEMSGNIGVYNLIGFDGISKTFCNESQMVIATTMDLSAFSATVKLKYTKTTD